jgi:hypothetical protein
MTANTCHFCPSRITKEIGTYVGADPGIDDANGCLSQQMKDRTGSC